MAISTERGRVFGAARLLLGLHDEHLGHSPHCGCSSHHVVGSMSIVLQHITSGLYYHGPGSWMRELSGAFDFDHSQRAIDFARQRRLSGVEVVVTFIDNGVVETYTTRIESPPRMPALAAAA